MTKPLTGIRRLSDELEHLNLNFDDTIIHSRLWDFEKRVSDSGLSIKLGVRGTEHYCIEGRHYALTPGHYLLVNRHQQFDCQVRSSRTVEAICLYLSPEVVQETYHTLRDSGRFPLQVVTNDPSFHFLEKRYRLDEDELGRFLRETAPRLLAPDNHHLDLSGFYYTLAEKLLCSQLRVRQRLSNLSAIRRTTREELFRRLSVAHQYILENYATDLQLDQLARVALLSKYHLLRTYKEVYGVTPYRQALDLRLERARTLLREGRSLEDIAFELGFSDRRAFAKAFRKKYGMAPGRYRMGDG